KFFKGSAHSEVLPRGAEQGSGNQPDRRLVTRSLFVRPLRGHRRQKRRHAGLPAKTRRPIPRSLKKERKHLWQLKTQTQPTTFFPDLKLSIFQASSLVPERR